MKIEQRPWKPQDLLDDLQSIIDEEPDLYLNTRRVTLCMARDYLKEYFSLLSNDPLTLEELRQMVGKPVWISCVRSAEGEYHIVRAFGKNSIVFEEYDREFGTYKSLFLGNYGKNWIAYRRKPEE